MIFCVVLWRSFHDILCGPFKSVQAPTPRCDLQLLCEIQRVEFRVEKGQMTDERQKVVCRANRGLSMSRAHAPKSYCCAVVGG